MQTIKDQPTALYYLETAEGTLMRWAQEEAQAALKEARVGDLGLAAAHAFSAGYWLGVAKDYAERGKALAEDPDPVEKFIGKIYDFRGDMIEELRRAFYKVAA